MAQPHYGVTVAFKLLGHPAPTVDMPGYALPLKHQYTNCIASLGSDDFFQTIGTCRNSISEIIWNHTGFDVVNDRDIDVNVVTSYVLAVESGSQGNPEEFQDIHTTQQRIESRLSVIDTSTSNVQQQQSLILKQVRHYY